MSNHVRVPATVLVVRLAAGTAAIARFVALAAAANFYAACIGAVVGGRAGSEVTGPTMLRRFLRSTDEFLERGARQF